MRALTNDAGNFVDLAMQATERDKAREFTVNEFYAHTEREGHALQCHTAS